MPKAEQGHATIFPFWQQSFRARILGSWMSVLLMGYAANACADPETERFLKRCQAYRSEPKSQDFGVRLIKEKQKLFNHGVPIKLLLDRCDLLRFRVTLPNGKFTDIETDYPKIEDPDSKRNQYYWDPESPSGEYWLFRFYAWEWSGWRLVHKKTGRSIETVRECADAPIVVGKGFVSTICSGAYENVTPTLYVADFRSTETRWSGGLQLGQCKERETFGLEDMRFVSALQLSIRGYCSEPESKAAGPPDQIFTISKLGVSTKQRGKVLFIEWK